MYMLRKYLKWVMVYLKIVMPRNVLFMFLRELMMIIPDFVTQKTRIF